VCVSVAVLLSTKTVPVRRHFGSRRQRRHRLLLLGPSADTGSYSGTDAGAPTQQLLARLGTYTGLMGWPSQLWTSKFPTLEPEVVPSKIQSLDGTTSGSKVGSLGVQSWEGHPTNPVTVPEASGAKTKI
jgi:hypothetical protein